MSSILSDIEIGSLIGERKPIPGDYRKWLRLRKVRLKPVKKASKVVKSDEGNTFVVKVRLSLERPNSFSVILQYRHNSNDFHLVRCNGHHGPHTNKLEKRAKQGVTWFPENTPHIHRLTERYQNAPRHKADHYAEPTNEFTDFDGALEFFFNSFGFYFADTNYEHSHPLFK